MKVFKTVLMAFFLTSVGAVTSSARRQPFKVSMPEAGGASEVPYHEVVKKKVYNEPITISTKQAVISCMILALNSGFLNGCCLSGAAALDGTKQAVSAVTGAWTTSAVSIANGNTGAGVTQIKMIASYITGSLLAGLLNPNPKTFELSKSVGPSLLIGSALLFTSKSMFSQKHNLIAFSLAAIVNGMQNSITSVHTANLCRTAHFSGISSDMGTFLGQLLRGNKGNAMKLKVFAALAASFWIGGFASVFISNKMCENSLLLSAYFYLVTGLYFLGL